MLALSCAFLRWFATRPSIALRLILQHDYGSFYFAAIFFKGCYLLCVIGSILFCGRKKIWYFSHL